MMIEVVVVGEVSGKLESCEMGVEMLFMGFLVKKSCNVRILVFYIIVL